MLNPKDHINGFNHRALIGGALFNFCGKRFLAHFIDSPQKFCGH